MIQMRLLPIILVVFTLLPVQLRAEEPSLEPFLGKWSGIGVTEKFFEAGYFTYTERDLDLDVVATDQGFDITWTTGFRPDGSAGPVTLRKTTTLAFTKKGPGLFEAGESPPWTTGLRWARLVDTSLIVYIFEIDETGVPEISRYVRTINEAGEMELGFTRDLDGRPVRQVTGTLKRVTE